MPKLTTAQCVHCFALPRRFHEAHPLMPTAYPSAYVFTDTREEFLRAAKELSRDGKITKQADDEEEGDFRVRRTFDGVELIVSIRRSKLCRLVQPAIYDCPVAARGNRRGGRNSSCLNSFPNRKLSISPA